MTQYVVGLAMVVVIALAVLYGIASPGALFQNGRPASWQAAAAWLVPDSIYDNTMQLTVSKGYGGSYRFYEGKLLEGWMKGDVFIDIAQESCSAWQGEWDASREACFITHIPGNARLTGYDITISNICSSGKVTSVSIADSFKGEKQLMFDVPYAVQTESTKTESCYDNQLDISGTLEISIEAQPPAACIPDWECTEWGGCYSGYNYRTCIDINSCDSELGRPAETKACSSEEPEPECIPRNVFERYIYCPVWNMLKGWGLLK